jgi:hypothetical protein
VQCGVGLVGAQHNVRVQMTRVVIPLVQCKIPLRVEDGGLVEVRIEACPNESVEALKKVGQVSWRRFRIGATACVPRQGARRVSGLSMVEIVVDEMPWSDVRW